MKEGFEEGRKVKDVGIKEGREQKVASKGGLGCNFPPP